MAGHRRFERLLTDLESVVLPLTLMTCKRFCSLLVKPKIQTLSGVWFFKGGVGSTFNPRGLWPPMTGGYVPLFSSPSHQPSPWHHCLRWWRLAGCPPQFTLFHSAINTHWWSFMKRFVGILVTPSDPNRIKRVLNTGTFTEGLTDVGDQWPHCHRGISLPTQQ